ncbi:serine hydrolase domain-containing protein [Maricaulis salignorans]|uniref:CubicO group peptidase, beta-lactamase class C family n=1 Tax=Maricaulis salignorans TaxID=144026 RepID=A0A1G9UVM0_9PROT|nr:serine hydrolase domain-containing protein [Maricaulis salignorans]SDM63685.1 CubicO group peptidase, beta-lactamase class C family [Maricaulis salignorans]
MKTTRATIWGLRLAAATVTAGSLYLFAPWREAVSYLRPLPASVQDEVEHVLDYGLDGVILYIDRAGHEPEFHAGGWFDRELQIRADPHALFKIASISKLYIAAATSMLVADGQLDLDTTLADFFPELVDQIHYADRITLRMLLQHRSGIPNWVEDPDRWAITSGEVNDYLALVFDDPAEFEPDARYQYSNTNYLLIGNILDQTLGYPHQQFIRSEILDPLGLTNTFASVDDVDIERIPGGYDPGWPQENFRSRVHHVPGGSMVATAEDTGIFLRALNDGSLFTDEEQAIYSSVYEYGHTGLLAGYSSIARYHADIDAVVVQFVNTSGGNSWTATEVVYDRVLRILRRE